MHNLPHVCGTHSNVLFFIHMLWNNVLIKALNSEQFLKINVNFIWLHNFALIPISRLKVQHLFLHIDFTL